MVLKWNLSKFSRWYLPIRDSQIGRETSRDMTTGGNSVLSNSILSVTDLFPSQSHDVLCLMAPSLSSGSLNTSGESPVARQLPSWHTACPLVPAGHHVLTCCFIPVHSQHVLSLWQLLHCQCCPPYHCFVFVPCSRIEFVFVPCSRIEFVSWDSFPLESLCIPFLASFLSCHREAYNPSSH